MVVMEEKKNNEEKHMKVTSISLINRSIITGEKGHSLPVLVLTILLLQSSYFQRCYFYYFFLTRRLGCVVCGLADTPYLCLMSQ